MHPIITILGRIKMYKGVYTALVTPFTQDNKIDENKLKELIEMQIAGGVAGLVPVGTTAESPTLSSEETKKIIATVVKQVDGRVPIIAGAGSNSTQKAIEQTKLVAELGVDASLQVVPYYNKPSQEGLISHFTAIADAVDLPVILYEVPGRSAVSLNNSSIIFLTHHQGIVGVKVASGDISLIMDLIAECPEGFDVLSGDDNLTYPLMTLGGSGVISVAANLYPKLTVQLVDACIKENWKEARKLHYRLLPMFRSMFIESNPIPVKAAMAMKGYILEQYRLPLCKMSAENRSKLEKIITELE
jgi:4-hydroxy-tetrahydrodipicolinate synthase